jgi:hypothetical protein
MITTLALLAGSASSSTTSNVPAYVGFVKNLRIR